MINPLISIAMTTYNGEVFLEAQLESIVNQTYPNIEIIICDDSSTDQTLNILQKYSHIDNITYYSNTAQLGVVKNFEKALSLCRGEYIALADQDDIWDINKLEILYENIGDSLLIHSDAKLIDQDNNLLARSYFLFSNKKLRVETFEYFFNNDVTGCTTLFNKKLLELALPFPDTVIMHDWWLALCASKESKIKYLNKTLISYRQHQSNQVGAADALKINSHAVRVVAYQKKLFFLQTLHQTMDWHKNEIETLDDLIYYYGTYFDRNIRMGAFYIHIKYFKYFHDDKSIGYRVAGLFLSLFGDKIQQKLWRLINR